MRRIQTTRWPPPTSILLGREPEILCDTMIHWYELHCSFISVPYVSSRCSNIYPPPAAGSSPHWVGDLSAKQYIRARRWRPQSRYALLTEPWGCNSLTSRRFRIIPFLFGLHWRIVRQRGPSSWPVLNRARLTSRVPDYLCDVLGLAPGALVREQRQAVDVCRRCRWTQCKQCAEDLNPLPHDCT